MLFAWRPIWTSRRARGASSPRLYGVRRIRKIPPFVAKQKVFGIPIPRAQKESASSLRSTRALRVDDGERSTPSQTKKKEDAQRRSRVRLFFFCRGALRLLRDDDSVISMCIPSSKRRGGECVCVCVDIRKNISLCHSCLFLPTINRIKGRLLKKNWLSRPDRKRAPTTWKMEGLFHQPTKRHVRV